MNLVAAAAPPAGARRGRWRVALPWAALLGLLGVAQTLLVALTINYETARAQDEADALAGEAAADIRHSMLDVMQSLQALAWSAPPQPAWRDAAAALLRGRQDLRRVEWRGNSLAVEQAVDSPYLPQLFSQLPRRDLDVDTEVACNAARRAAAPMFSRSYFVPLASGQGLEVIDLCVPVLRAGPDAASAAGFLVGSLALARVLDASMAPGDLRRHEFSFVEPDGTRLARAGVPRGAGVFVADHVVDLPGTSLQLRADSGAGRPSVIPNLATALVLGLSIALFGVVLLLARDVRRRARAESALAESLAFRSAMEDSLSTGLRARDLDGAITYVNPAFCAMVGFTPDELLAPRLRKATPVATPGAAVIAPPYWPAECVADYQHRQQLRLGAVTGKPPPTGLGALGDAREGFETVFARKNGERFPVMIYEAPLVDGQGRHTGWMSAVLDLSAQRRAEELARQQQDRLQATARLATVGEMASLLSHELNQPLAAIASYASGSLNLLDTADSSTPALLQQALQRIAEQAERCGRVIKSVHDFVRRREQLHETLPAATLLDAVLPLARMQARKSGTQIDVDLPPAAAGARPLRVRCDRTMVEQVLLNLARNGIQAMEGSATAPADRVLTLRVRQTQRPDAGWVAFAVVDAGPGITPDVAARLFTPFFTTRSEGMGLGLSLCRTVIEQHGGALDFGPRPDGLRGTEFRFTLPAPAAVESGETAASPSSLAA